jgi:hypothetical protein
MKIAESSSRASGRPSAVSSKPQHGAVSAHPLLQLQQRVGNRAVARLVQNRLQTQPADSSARGEKPKKPELEFHSALHFNKTFSGFNPTSEPEEGGYGILWWSVWNTGWTSAPEHTNRLSIYDAKSCSGCRRPEDEISRHQIVGPAIVSGDQQGKSDYDNAVLVGPLSAGLHEAFVQLDVDNQVDEINEDNNTAFLVFNIKPGKDESR